MKKHLSILNHVADDEDPVAVPVETPPVESDNVPPRPVKPAPTE